MALFVQDIAPMNASTYLQSPPKRKLMGWAWVVGLHALLFGALQAGLDRTVVQNMPTVVQALLLEDRRPEVRSEPRTEPRPEPAKPVPPPLLKPETPPVKTPPQSPAPTVVEPAVVAQANANAIAAASPPPAPANTSAPASPAATAVAAPKPAAPARTTANVNMAQCEKPEYPSASRRMEEEGTVALRFLVGIDGKIVQSEIEKSSGYKRLDEAARTGLSKCQFKPATVDGKPEQAWTTIRYVWRLD
jgi:protein TonB